jgi:hypothetical protein
MSQSVWKLPTKLGITNPWEVIWMDLIGLYTLRGKDGTEIDFICLTMINPASNWFEIVELHRCGYSHGFKGAKGH